MKINVKSTRNDDSASMDEAILFGLARDGGLYVPEVFPDYRLSDFKPNLPLAAFAEKLLAPFFAQSQIVLDKTFCEQVFSFPLSLKTLEQNIHVLELFHGPTLSFKDFGACFFAQCLQELAQQKPITVLVATSGDTGSAVAHALHGKTGVKGVILFPKGKISIRQQAQITCWGDNIQAIAVDGTFDQCQALVKRTFADGLGDERILTTANSINIARLLPQILFYAYTSTKLAFTSHQLVNFIVPSGNLGNVTACYWAKKIGFPIGEILIANNANHVLADYINKGSYQPHPSIHTLANAMDVGDPSNLERLINLFPDFAQFKENMDVLSVSDTEIQEAIKDCYQRYAYLICPHTATAFHRLNTIDKTKPWVITATAHPAKFNEVLESLLNIQIPIPDSLQKLLAKQQSFVEIPPDYAQLRQIL